MQGPIPTVRICLAETPGPNNKRINFSRPFRLIKSFEATSVDPKPFESHLLYPLWKSRRTEEEEAKRILREAFTLYRLDSVFDLSRLSHSVKDNETIRELGEDIELSGTTVHETCSLQCAIPEAREDIALQDIPNTLPPRASSPLPELEDNWWGDGLNLFPDIPWVSPSSETAFLAHDTTSNYSEESSEDAPQSRRGMHIRIGGTLPDAGSSEGTTPFPES